MSDTVRETADALIACCRENRTDDALNTLYHADAVSVEAGPAPGFDDPAARGLDAIRGKHAWWDGAMEMHDFSVEGPFMHGPDRFGVIFEMDVTDKASGQRSQTRELGVYTVDGDGKITREEFFNTM